MQKRLNTEKATQAMTHAGLTQTAIAGKKGVGVVDL